MKSKTVRADELLVGDRFKMAGRMYRIGNIFRDPSANLIIVARHDVSDRWSATVMTIALKSFVPFKVYYTP